MRIKLAEFIISNSVIKYCPENQIPEYAFIGRSNVGKSSLINMIVQQKKLAKTSGTPGKTQLVNHFKINNEWFLVDLPGYGYARTSKTSRSKFQKIITSYFEKRDQLINTFLLVDIRHPPQPIDLEFMQWLGENSQPFSIVFTKADKLKPKAIKLMIEDYSKKMLESSWEEMPPYFISSAINGMGRDEILEYIEKINVKICK